MSVTIYGIKNCDTMKKAFAWLKEQGIAYDFHDYKKAGVDEDVLKEAIAGHGWERVINQRGTTWRKLPEDVRASMDADGALAAAKENASLVKRPLLVDEACNSYLGFSEDMYAEIFKA